MIEECNVCIRFGAGLEKQEAVLFGELFCFLVGDVSLRFEIALVANKIDGRVRMGETARVRQPAAQMVVCAASGNVIDHESARRASIVASRHRSESLLASCVPICSFN